MHNVSIQDDALAQAILGKLKHGALKAARTEN
jgi:hypothetical protein